MDTGQHIDTEQTDEQIATATLDPIIEAVDEICALANQKKISGKGLAAEAFLYTLHNKVCQKLNFEGSVIDKEVLNTIVHYWKKMTAHLKKQVDFRAHAPNSFSSLIKGLYELDELTGNTLKHLNIEANEITILTPVSEDMLGGEHFKFFDAAAKPRKTFLREKVPPILESLPPYDSVKSQIISMIRHRNPDNKEAALKPIRDWKTVADPIGEKEAIEEIDQVTLPSSKETSGDFGRALSSIKGTVRQAGPQYRTTLLNLLIHIERESISVGDELSSEQIRAFGDDVERTKTVLIALRRLNILEKDESEEVYRVARKPSNFLKTAILLALNHSTYTSNREVNIDMADKLVMLATHPTAEVLDLSPNALISNGKYQKASMRGLNRAVGLLDQSSLPFLTKDSKWDMRFNKSLMHPHTYVRLNGLAAEKNTFFPCWKLPNFYNDISPIEVGVTFTPGETKTDNWLCTYTVFDGEKQISAEDWLNGKARDIGEFSAEELSDYVTRTADIANHCIKGLVSNNSNKIEISIPPAQAAHYLEIIKPVVEELGFRFELPKKLNDIQYSTPSVTLKSTNGKLSIRSIVNNFDLQILIGGREFSLEEIETIIRDSGPVINIGDSLHVIDETALRAATTLAKKKDELSALQILAEMELASSNSELAENSVSFTGERLEEIRHAICRPKEEFERVSQATEFIGALKPFQHTTYNWKYWMAVNGIGTCNSMYMGLGKTVVELATIQKIFEDFSGMDDILAEPHLVLAPKHVKHQWVGNANCDKPYGAAFFTPKLNTYSYVRGKEIPNGVNLAVLSYEDFLKDFQELVKRRWSGVTLDEVQRIRNEKKLGRAVRQINAGYRSGLTGTLYQNNIGEVLSIHDWLNPGIFGNRKARQRIASLAEKGDVEKRFIFNTVREVSAPYVHIVKPDDPGVQASLPPLIKESVSLKPSKVQIAYMKKIIERERRILMKDDKDKLKGKKSKKKRNPTLSFFHKMNAIAHHPTLSILASNGKDEDGKDLLRKYANADGTSPKLQFLKKQAKLHLDQGQTALFFSPSVKALHVYRDRLIKHLEKSGQEEQVLMYTGQNTEEELKKVLSILHANEKPHIAFFSTRAADTGLNLHMAEFVYHLDSWFNPAVQDQATARARRIGSESAVHEIVVILENTLDQVIQEMHLEKREEDLMLFRDRSSVSEDSFKKARLQLLDRVYNKLTHMAT